MISHLPRERGGFSAGLRNTARSNLFGRSVVVGLYVVVLHDFAPGLHLVADEGTFDLWSTEGQTHLLSFHQLFCDAFLAQGRSHLVAESVDDVFRSASRCKNAPPGIGF